MLSKKILRAIDLVRKDLDCSLNASGHLCYIAHSVAVVLVVCRSAVVFAVVFAAFVVAVAIAVLDGAVALAADIVADNSFFFFFAVAVAFAVVRVIESALLLLHFCRISNCTFCCCFAVSPLLLHLYVRMRNLCVCVCVSVWVSLFFLSLKFCGVLCLCVRVCVSVLWRGFVSLLRLAVCGRLRRPSARTSRVDSNPWTLFFKFLWWKTTFLFASITTFSCWHSDRFAEEPRWNFGLLVSPPTASERWLLHWRTTTRSRRSIFASTKSEVLSLFLSVIHASTYVDKKPDANLHFLPMISFFAQEICSGGCRACCPPAWAEHHHSELLYQPQPFGSGWEPLPRFRSAKVLAERDKSASVCFSYISIDVLLCTYDARCTCLLSGVSSVCYVYFCTRFASYFANSLSFCSFAVWGVLRLLCVFLSSVCFVLCSLFEFLLVLYLVVCQFVVFTSVFAFCCFAHCLSFCLSLLSALCSALLCSLSLSHSLSLVFVSLHSLLTGCISARSLSGVCERCLWTVDPYLSTLNERNADGARLGHERYLRFGGKFVSALQPKAW